MKRICIISFFAVLTTVFSNAQSSDEKELIKETIIGFSKAGDDNNADNLAKYLDDNYRIVMNRLFGSNEVYVMSKEVYLEKIRTKEYGGDSRKVAIESILLNGSIASAKVSFSGTKMIFVSIITLIKDGDNQWKLISDVPLIE